MDDLLKKYQKTEKRSKKINYQNSDTGKYFAGLSLLKSAERYLEVGKSKKNVVSPVPRIVFALAAGVAAVMLSFVPLMRASLIDRKYKDMLYKEITADYYQSPDMAFKEDLGDNDDFYKNFLMTGNEDFYR